MILNIEKLYDKLMEEDYYMMIPDQYQEYIDSQIYYNRINCDYYQDYIDDSYDNV